MAGNAQDNNWMSQIIGGNPTTVTGTGVAATKVTSNPLAVSLYNMTDPQRLEIAKTLKNAGYKVPLTGKYNDQLLAQWSNLTMGAQMQAQSIGQKYDENFLQGYIQQQQILNAQTGAGGDFERKKIYDPTQAAAVVNAVYADLLGRKASKNEMDKYTKMLQKAQAANPQKFTDTAGAGYTETGGIDPQQFLVQQIAGTDEAKTKSVMNYYDSFKNLIGVR